MRGVLSLNTHTNYFSGESTASVCFCGQRECKCTVDVNVCVYLREEKMFVRLQCRSCCVDFMAPCLTTSNLIQLRARAALPTRQYAETIKKSERETEEEVIIAFPLTNSRAGARYSTIKFVH